MTEPDYKGFAIAVMSDFPDSDGVDGFELQELGVFYELLIPTPVNAPCGKGCRCEEYYATDEMAEGVTCYRKAWK